MNKFRIASMMLALVTFGVNVIQGIFEEKRQDEVIDKKVQEYLKSSEK